MVLRNARSRLLSHLTTLILLSVCQGCGPKAPIVSSPIEPWETEIVHEKVARREEEHNREAAKQALQNKDGLGREKPVDEHSVIVTTLADIIAFPLRGAAWLAHTIL